MRVEKMKMIVMKRLLHLPLLQPEIDPTKDLHQHLQVLQLVHLAPPQDLQGLIPEEEEEPETEEIEEGLPQLLLPPEVLEGDLRNKET